MITKKSAIRNPPSAIPKTSLGKIADDIDRMNTRQRQIQARLGVIGAESARLNAEQHGIELKRIAKQREFDSASAL